MTSERADYLDGWRGLAVLLLLIGHFYPVPGINLGRVGVNLFFVLSGLLMARLLFVKQVPIGVFYRRRIARIVPAAYVYLMLLTVTFVALDRPVAFGHLAASAGFIINYTLDGTSQVTMPLGHFWSLCVEEHSYILLGLVALLVRRKHVSVGVILGAMTLVSASFSVWYWLLYGNDGEAATRLLRTEVAAFGLLAAAFLAVHFNAKPFSKTIALACPLLLGLGVAMHWWSIPAPVSTILGAGFFALAVNLMSGTPPFFRHAMAIAPLRQLGLWSFSIYIWQQPFYYMVNDGQMSGWTGMLMSMFAGVASFYFVETPARTFLNRHWTGFRPASVAV